MRTPSLSRRPAPPVAEPLWLEWLALAGLFAFAGWLLGARGVWQLLLADPTGITFVIIVIFAASTVWCGKRARELGQQHRPCSAARAGPRSTGALAAAPRDAYAPLDLLVERTHGVHGTAWWVNGIQLKLGCWAR